MPRERRVVSSARVHVRAVPADVFSWVTEPGRVPTWVKDLVESRPRDKEGTLAVGARSVEVLKMGGALVNVEAEVTAFEQDQLIENRLDMPEGPVTSRVLITPAEAGCYVTHTMEAVVTGMGYMPSWLLQAVITQRVKSDLQRLKERAEGG